MTAHASTMSKFGIPSENIVSVILASKLPIAGLHMHIGTQMDNMKAFVSALDFMHGLVDEIEAASLHRMDILDIGGGLGIHFLPGDEFPTLTHFAATLKSRFRKNRTYVVEPGHAIVGTAVGLLSCVQEIKTLRSRRWAILDVGTDQLIKVTLLSWRHQILNKQHVPLPTEGPDAVGGPHCYAGDVLLPATNLDGVQRGDPLFIQHAGAYCFAVANHFNGKLGPSHVTVDDDGVVRGSYPAEDGFCDHAMLGHSWIDAFNSAEGVEGEAVADDERCPDRATELDINKIKPLSSNYLSNTLNTDSYELIRAAQHGPRTLVFIAAASSPLGSISMPFAVRIASDATIIAALHLMGKETKDVDVFGSHLNMTSNSVIKTSAPLTVRIYVTPAINVGGTHSVHQAQWDINNGKFKGTFRFIV